MSTTKKNQDATDNTRRRLIRALGGAGAGAAIAHRAFSEGWKGPVVDSVMVPVHALTTPGGVNFFGSLVLEIVSNLPNESILDWMLQPAQAGIFPVSGNPVCVSIVGGQVATAAALMWVPPLPLGCEVDWEIGEAAMTTPGDDPVRGSTLADFFVQEAQAGGVQEAVPCEEPAFASCAAGSGAIGSWISLSPNDGLDAQLRVLAVGGTAPTRYADVQLRRRLYPGAPVQTSEVDRIFEEMGACSCATVDHVKKPF